MIKNRMIEVAAASPKIRVGNPKYNTDQICEMIDQNCEVGILVFPELCISGYTCGDLFQNRMLLDECKRGLFRIAAKTRDYTDLLVAVGLPLEYRNKIYNCAAFVTNGYVKLIVPKINVPNYGEFYEERWFAPGKDIKREYISFDPEGVPFGTKYFLCDEFTGISVGAEICEDMWVPDKPSTHLCEAGANIIVNLSASDEVIGKEEFRRNLVSMQSASCYCGYIYNSAGTGESSTDLVYSGHSIIAENGHILSDTIYPTGGSVSKVIIDVDTILYNREKMNTFGCCRDEYKSISFDAKCITNHSDITAKVLADTLREKNYNISRLPFVPESDKERRERCEKILRIQANGLATRVMGCGIKNLVIGISGGLDSTLALIVADEAKKIVPDVKIIGITMPSSGNTTSKTYQNSLSLMNALADDARDIRIDESVKVHLKDIGHGEEYHGDGDTAYENAQARMRTFILMDTANMENALVIGTGDLSELALGWCTYNGDHMSMYAVNVSIPKTLVKFLIQTYADTLSEEKYDLKQTLYDIIDTPISPELTPANGDAIAQKTEEKIGKYDLNDFFLFYTLRYGMDCEKNLAFAMTAFPELDEEEIKNAEIRFYSRFFRQQFKRSCLPDGPKVGSVSLSPRGDWRMPSDADGSFWIERIKNA